MRRHHVTLIGALLLAAGVAAGQEAKVPNVVLDERWMDPVTPVIKLWAAPGELHIDPMTGKPQNPFVADRDFRKGNAVWDAEARTVKLAAARNEVIGFQLLVEAAGEDVRYARVKPSELKAQAGDAAIPARAYELFRVWYTEVVEPSRTFRGGFNALGLPSTGMGWYGDALIPFHVRGWGAPFGVAEGRNQSVWVDLKIPKKLPAGTYTGTIDVTADRAKPAKVAVELTVWDFDLPDRPTARAEAPFYRATIPGAFGGKPEVVARIERDYFRMARAHRFSAYIYDTWPDLKRGLGDDEIQIDWTNYDKRFGQYLDGSAFDDKQPMDQWYVAIDTRWPSPRGWADSKPDVFYKRIEKAIKAYDDHFKEKGWNPKCMYVFFQGLDEPSREEQYVKIRKVAEAVHRGSSRIKMRHDFYTAFANPKPLLERFGDVMDIWNISGCFYPVKELQAQQARGREAWFYQGSEPWIGSENLDNDALGLRTWAWIGWKYRVDCWHNWCSGRWSGENIFVNPNNGNARQAWRPNSNGVMIYPGSLLGVEELFPSIRLKAYRRGNTDYEYMAMLKAAGQGARADAIVDTIIHKALGEAGNDRNLIGRWGDWSHDPDQWAAARIKLAEAVLAVRKQARK